VELVNETDKSNYFLSDLHEEGAADFFISAELNEP
jgi:hypothetical protein